MGGTSKTEQQTQQSSQTNPWEPTQGLLKDIIGGVQGQYGNTAPTSAETGALNTLQQNAQSQPNYAPQAIGLSNELQGNTTGGAQGILGGAYNDYLRRLSPVADQNNDPTQTPGIMELLKTIRGDVSNSVNGMFAGAGRDLSGLNVQALSRGISQGEAPVLLDQYNRNVAAQQGAAGNAFNAGGATASGMQDLTQQGFANRAQGLDIGVNGVPAAQNAGATGILNAESLRRNLPLQNLAGILGLTLPIAGLGGQSTGTSNTQGSKTASGMEQLVQGTQAFKNVFGGAGDFMKLLSDRRAKEDIEQVGKLPNGLPVYLFRYKSGGGHLLGLMADDVEKVLPDAVSEQDGFKMVDYGLAMKWGGN